jgi:Protein of unknown function (DUF1553)/Protein of unknown function (DUF1549)/Planctomycete cytochrome C
VSRGSRDSRNRWHFLTLCVAVVTALWTVTHLPATRASTATSSTATARHASGTPLTGSRQDNFNSVIAPILQQYCIRCHSGLEAAGKLRLDSEAGVLRGGASGKAIIPGDSQHSLLMNRLLGLGNGPRMPLGSAALPAAQIKLIQAWIDQGKFDTSANRIQPVASHPLTHAESPLFASEIRPIFAARCYECHGPKVHHNGLRLDSLASALKGGDNGKVIVPGDGTGSPLMRRILGLDKPQMPYGGPSLSSQQVASIRHWIQQGAPGPDSSAPITIPAPLRHWAYVKPVRPPLPAVKDRAWCRNPIDYFVLARLEKEGLKPSPEADKATLIRRVYLDLIGLPPTPEQVDAFLADTRPDAYDRVVEQLLASPHYGEKWARPWLDLARYADSHGYEQDPLRVAWKYRDWVINALNQNMSFKEFTIEQIAGDMLPHPTTNQLIATGFHRNTMLNKEGGVDREEYRWYSLIDRVNTTATVWLGLTLGCAQCHNHKFDPFTQKDYYRFLAFFDNVQYKVLDLGQGEGYVEEPELELPNPDQARKASVINQEKAAIQTELDTETPQLEAAQVQWEKEMRREETEWQPLAPSHAASLGGATLSIQPDHSILAGGKNPDADTYTIEASTNITGISALRIEVLADPSLSKGGPGRDADGNFFLSNVELEARPAVGNALAEKIQFRDAADDEAQGGYEIQRIFKKKKGDDELHGWAIDDSLSSAVKLRQAVLIPQKPFGFKGGTLLTIRLEHRMLHTARNMGRFRLSVTSMADPLRSIQLAARLRPVLDKPASQRSPEEKKQLAAAYRSIAPLLQPARDRLKALNQNMQNLGIVTALIVREKPGSERPSTYVHIRGAYLSKGEKVYAEVPAILGPLPSDQKPNRLGLAYWLVSDNNPLTARVTVNHFWQEIFGHGIVETAEDFGSQGDPPTNPELLDWLATQFMRTGWNVKNILRLIVTSATYRQSSRVTPELLERDPYNKLLARGPRFRVDAEMVRDIALSASGLLNPEIGGPSVFPYQPAGVWDRPYSDAKWVTSKGSERYRRGIYIFIRRTAPYPSLLTFDAPTREFCTVRRPRTNTPLQALTTLNDPVFFEAAQAMAWRLEKQAGTNPAARAAYGFRLCVSRKPTAAELAQILGFYRQELGYYRDHPQAAAQVAGRSAPAVASAAPAPVLGDEAEAAAWTMVSNVLLNLDETITKE